ncbi:unnamed protein product [Effrenium voratum]|nr:unnamed protein product [Effrenium voratum]
MMPRTQQLLPYPTWSPLGNMDDMKLPGPLSFVQSDWFLVVSGLVVAFNIMCMYIQVACSLSEEDRKILSKVNEANGAALRTFQDKLLGYIHLIYS